MNDQIIERLEEVVGEDWLVNSRGKIQGYLQDETPKPMAPDASEDVVVVKPKDADEISKIMKTANELDTPVVPRGAGTGLCGAATPTNPSIILSLERLNEIIEIDEDNLMATCEAGVSLESLFEAIESTENLFFPPHPGDEGAQIGGLVVENAGGARAVKYGVMRNYVKGMNVVLPTGEKVKLGGKVLKNNTGYDLMHLLMGSEGTLGIVTEVTLRLYPEAKKTSTLLVPFQDRNAAMNSVPRVLKEGYVPLALEYVEKDLIDESAEHLGKSWPANEGEAFLILIITGKDDDEIFNKSGKLVEIFEEAGALEPLLAQRSKEQDLILDIRSNIYTALENETTDILDVTVPPAKVGELMNRIDALAEEYETRIPVYGHVADGNVHPHIMNVEGEAPDYSEDLKEQMYRDAIDLGGVITGEHGIGETRLKNLPLALTEVESKLMRGVKEVFDPNNVLNPNKAIG